MKDALKSFGLVTLITLFCLVSVWFYLRQRALTQPVSRPLSHKILSENVSKSIAYRGATTTGKANTEEAFDQAVAAKPDILLWADVVPDESRNLKVDGTPLADFISRYKNNLLVLNFSKYGPGILENIIRDIETTKAADRILIQSPEDGLLRELREKRPMWAFGTSQTQTTIMKMLSSLGLEAVAPTKGDVLVIEWAHIEPAYRQIDDRLIKEAHRRQMRVFAGPVRDAAEANALLQRGVDAVLVNDPKIL